MSLLLWPISKLPLTKKPVSSCFSTTSRSKPYLFLGTKIKENTLNFNLYDPTGNKEVVKNLNFEDQSETLRNLFKESWAIGSSRGHLALRNRKDSSVHLVDISNQLEPKIISLPPLHFDNGETHVRNVSVSSPVNGDVIVAVKFWGSRLSLCRAGDSEWTWIDIPCPSFKASTVIYSERDERFYLYNWNPGYSGPIDFTPKTGLVIPVSGYLKFPLRNLEEFEKVLPYLSNFGHQLELVLVESPSGQLFIVYWFIEKGKNVDWDDNYSKTRKIFVFKQDEEQKISTSTNDIGDLCIFIGRNEAFCVSAKDYPGLKPNSVYFATSDYPGFRPKSVYFASYVSDVGVYDLSSQTILHLCDDLTYQRSFGMFWIPPTPTPTPTPTLTS